MKYYVERVLHNGKTGNSDYKATKQFDNYDDAEKEFYNILATYIKYNDLDRVCVILFDQFGNPLLHKDGLREKRQRQQSNPSPQYGRIQNI